MSWRIEIDGPDERLLVHWRDGQPAIDGDSPFAARLLRWFRGRHEFQVGLKPVTELATAGYDVEHRRIASEFELALVAYRTAELPGVRGVRVEQQCGKRSRGAASNLRDG